MKDSKDKDVLGKGDQIGVQLLYYIQHKTQSRIYKDINPFPTGGGPNRPPLLENVIYSKFYLGK